MFCITLCLTSTFVLWVDETELKRDRKVRPFSMFEPTEAPATSLRKNQSSDDLVRDAQVRVKIRSQLLLSSKKKNTLARFVLPTEIQHTILSFSSFHFSVCSQGSGQSASSRPYQTERP